MCVVKSTFASFASCLGFLRMEIQFKQSITKVSDKLQIKSVNKLYFYYITFCWVDVTSRCVSQEEW